jgi:hypothetical protein
MILFFTEDPRSGVRPFVRDFVLLEKLVIGARGGEALHEQLVSKGSDPRRDTNHRPYFQLLSIERFDIYSTVTPMEKNLITLTLVPYLRRE